MSKKKTKEDNTSTEARSSAKRPGGKRLSDMLDYMKERSNPIGAHKVASKYFETFREDRKLTEEKPEKKKGKKEGKNITAVTTAVGNAVSSAVDTAVTTAVNKGGEKKEPGKRKREKSVVEIEDLVLTRSEYRVYEYMYERYKKTKTKDMRFGLKELKAGSGLSDKTVRVAVHGLIEKLNIKVLEPSLGVYGRKFRIYTPKEIKTEREKEGVVIDPVLKKVSDETTAVAIAVSGTVKSKKSTPKKK